MKKISENKHLQPIRLNERINFIYAGKNARLAFTLTNSGSYADGIFLKLYDAIYLNKMASCLLQERLTERFRNEKFSYIDFVDEQDINALYKKFRQSQALKDLGIKVELADNPDFFTLRHLISKIAWKWQQAMIKSSLIMFWGIEIPRLFGI